MAQARLTATQKTRQYTISGLAATLIITITSAMRGWPFPNLSASPWLFQLSSHGRVERYTFLAMFAGGVGGLCWSWVCLVRLSKTVSLSGRLVMGVFALWALPLLFSAPLFSGDVYVYLVDGQAFARGFDPYSAGVSAMGAAPIVHMVYPTWRDTKSMYGPLFMRLAQLVTNVAGDNIVAGVMVLRAITVATVALMGVSLAHLARRLRRPAGAGLVFALLNPLTMLHLIGGVHNDAMMLGFLAAGLAVGYGRTGPLARLAAIGLCVIGACVKFPGFAGILVLGWLWAGADASYRRRATGAALAGAVGVAFLEIVGLVTGLNWDWTRALNVPGLAHPVLAPANAVALALGGIFGSANGINDVTRDIATPLSLVLATWFILRTGRRGSPEAVIRGMGLALLVMAWLSPAVYPWYLTWGIAVVGITGLGNLQRPLIAAVVAVSFAVTPGGYGTFDLFFDWRRAVFALVALAIMALGLRWTLTRQAISWRPPRVVPHALWFNIVRSRKWFYRTFPDVQREG